MKKSRTYAGFTVVEMIIVIIVVSILAILSTLAMSNVQVKARDEERKADIEAIARGLELRYKNGNTKAGAEYKAGSYPSVNELFTLGWNNLQSMTTTLPGTTNATLTAPSGNYGLRQMCIFENPSGYWSTQPGCENVEDMTANGARRFVIKTNSDGTKDGSSPHDYYVYEPIQWGAWENKEILCYSNICHRYNLYYYHEETDTIKVVKSKRNS